METTKHSYRSNDTDQHSANRISQALNALQPDGRTLKLVTFSGLYNDIEAALARGVTQTAVRKALTDTGLPLSAATFKKLLESERTRRKTESMGSARTDGGVA